MKSFKYIAVLILYSFLLVLDFLFVLTTIGMAFDDKDASVSDGAQVGAVVVCAVISAFLIFLTVKCRSYGKKVDGTKNKVLESVKIEKTDKIKPADSATNKSTKCVGIGRLDVSAVGGSSKPNYEIKYRDAEGNISVRKIFVRRFDGRVLEAHCFLRGEERTFYVPRIVECVDLETGEVINADEFYGDLRWYFCKRFNKRYKPSDMFNFEEWSGFSFSSFTPLLGEMDRFEINEVFVMKIADYDEGFITRKFSCGSVWTTRSEGFYISLENTNGTLYDIAFNKIISVEGIEDFGKYLNDKFLNSDEGKAVRLQKNCEEELSILIYLARADSAFTAKKRNVICEYLKNSGHDCSDEILVLIGKKIKVELNAFKKYVCDYSVKIDLSKKPLFLAAANEIVGGKEKAKPFGLAGLQYIESKIKP